MPNYTSYIMLQNITHILDALQKLAASSYKSCDTHSRIKYTRRSSPCGFLALFEVDLRLCVSIRLLA